MQEEEVSHGGHGGEGRTQRVERGLIPLIAFARAREAASDFGKCEVAYISGLKQ